MRLSFIRRHLRFMLLVLILLITAGVFVVWRFGGGYASYVIREKLQQIVSGHLNAELEMGDVTYEYPLGVLIQDVSLIADPAHGENVKLASFKSLHLQLAKSPFSEGPLVIERIDIESPTLHLIRKSEGFVGAQRLIRTDHEKRSLEQKVSSIPTLSDVFHLRHMQLSKMSVRYEDWRLPNPVPLLWENLDMTIDSLPTDELSHRYTFLGHAGNLAQLQSKGELNLDSLVLAIDELTLSAELSKNQTSSPLPPALQQLLSKWQVEGKAQFQLSGSVPLRSLESVDLKGSLKLIDVASSLPETTIRLANTSLDMDCLLKGSKASAKINSLKSQSGHITADLKPLEVSIDLADGIWSASAIQCTITSKPVLPPTSFDNQPFVIDLIAQLTSLPDSNAMKIAIVGTQMKLDSIDQILAIDALMVLDQSSLLVEQAMIKGLGGSITAHGDYRADSSSFNLQATLNEIELQPIQCFFVPDKKDEIKGNLSGELHFADSGASLQLLTGSGVLHLRNGQFGQVPVLAGIATTIGIGEKYFVADAGDIRFKIESQKINLEKISIRTKAFIIAGNGTIGLDESLNLELYAAAAGDWGKGIKDTDIPIISDIGGMIGTGTQKVVNGLTSQVSSMTVTGTLKEPKVRPNPAPILTDPIKKLFSSEEK